LEQPFVIGLLLLGLSPGAPFIPKLVQLAKGDVPFAVALMTVLMIGTVFDLPLVLPRIITRVQVNAWQVEKTLLLLVLLPLLAGLVAHAKLPSLPGWLPRALGRLSNLSGLLVIVLIVSLNFNSVLSLFGTGAVFGGFLFAALCLITGWLLGFPLPDPATRRALGLATGSRNVAAALIVGAQNFKDPKVNVMVITTAVIGLILLIPAAIVLRRRVRAQFRPTPSVSSGHHTF
jgi:BASS family bile acid:Na+ symporter